LAEVHQDLDQLLHADAERLREVPDGDAGLDADRTGGRRRGRPALALLVLARAPAAAAVAGAAAVLGRVDDDPALAVAGAVAARAERSVRTVSHQCPQCKGAQAPDRPAPSAAAPVRRRDGSAPARSTRAGGRCRRPGPAPALPPRARRPVPRSAAAPAAA